MTERHPSPDVGGTSEASVSRRYRFRWLPSSGAITTRFGWGLADQSLSSITNFALGVAVARSVGPREFGAFGVAFGVYTAGLGLARAVTSEPLMVRFSAASADRWNDGVRAAVGCTLALGALLGVACIASGLALGEDQVLSSALLALGLTFPGVLIQDTWRFAFFASRRGSAAFANDVVWAAALAGAVTLLVFTDRGSVGTFILAWGVSGTVAAAFGCWQAHASPAPARWSSWLREHRDLIPRFAGEFGVATLATQTSVLLIGTVASLSAIGTIRAGQLLFGPLNVLFMGAGIAGLPEAVRLRRVSHLKLRRACIVLSSVLAASALCLGFVLALTPTSVGRIVLGDNWAGARAIVTPMAIWMAGFGVVLGAGVGLRALAAASSSFRARLLIAPVTVSATVAGAAAAGASGAAWGFAIAAWIGVVVWWRQFHRALRESHHAGARPGAAMPSPQPSPRPDGFESSSSP